MGKRYLPIKGPIYSFFGFWANVNGPKNREYRLVYTLETLTNEYNLVLEFYLYSQWAYSWIFRFFWILIQTIFRTYQQNQKKISHMT